MYTLKLGRTTMLVIGRAGPAIDLLDKRSSKYSSRARLIMTSELVSRGLRMTFMPYSDLWRRQRRLLHQLTSPAASSTYEPIQEQESTQIVLDMLNDPANHWPHCQVSADAAAWESPGFHGADLGAVRGPFPPRLALRRIDDHADRVQQTRTDLQGPGHHAGERSPGDLDRRSSVLTLRGPNRCAPSTR